MKIALSHKATLKPALAKKVTIILIKKTLMKKTFLFYDIETTGLNKAFDQILQFASIRTDEKFNEIERHNISISLRPDVVPSPEAVVTHMIFGDDGKGISELEAVSKIHKMINRPGTISLGYNTLGFDDEFLRFSFYRNLLPPYTHQYASGCGRMDIFTAAIFFHYYRNDAIVWPEKEGKLSLKLEEINRVNGFADGMAHDALVDVEATLALARRLSGHREIWEYLSSYFSKNEDMARIDKLPVAFDSSFGRHKTGLMVSSDFGYTFNHHAPVLLLGGSIPYKNQTLWLRLDLPDLATANLDNVREKTRVERKRLGEPGFLLPPSDRFIKHISKDRMTLANENLKWLKSNPEIFNAIVHYHANFRYPEVPNVDADAALYVNGFFSKHTEELGRRFSGSDYDSKISMLGEFKEKVPSTISKRMMFRNYPDSIKLPEIEKERSSCISSLSGAEEKVPVDHRGERKLTPSASLKKIDDMQSGRTEWAMGPDQIAILNDLKDYIGKNFS